MSSYVLTIFLFDEALAGLTFFSIQNIGSTTAEPKAPSLICLDKVYIVRPLLAIKGLDRILNPIPTIYDPPEKSSKVKGGSAG